MEGYEFGVILYRRCLERSLRVSGAEVVDSVCALVPSTCMKSKSNDQ